MEAFVRDLKHSFRMFGEHRPARTTVQVAGLPGDGLRVEIDAIAYKP